MFSQIKSITGKKSKDRVYVSSRLLPIKKTKKHTRHSTKKPYQTSRPEDKDPSDICIDF